MTDQERMQKLKALQLDPDTEIAHHFADDILCDLLKELGYAEVVQEYEKIEKWYA